MAQISELRAKLDRRELSAVDLTLSYLERIKKLDGTINAYLHVNEELALKAAEKAQERINRGKASALTGIPVAVKDNLCTTDMPTTCASRMLEGYIPPYDATVIQRLRDSGAIILGKVNLDEFAMGASTRNSYYKKTVNPYDITRVPGGSSGGSAASVAARLAVASLGSDTGGSIRQPAAFCGVTGIRPTYGRVPRYGCVAFASSLDQVGPIAESAQDCALMLETISGADSRDQTCNGDKFNSKGIFGNSLKGKRIGVIKQLIGSEVNTEILLALENVIKWYRAAGATVDYVDMPALSYGVPAYYLISSAEASANLSRFDGIRYGHRAEGERDFNKLISLSRAEGFGWEVKRRIMLGSYALCSGYYDDYYKKAVRLAGIVKKEYNDAFASFDALLSPVAPTVAYKMDDMGEDPAKVYIADICTVSAALAGLPSIASPCGYDNEGLPIAFMLTGARWAEGDILGLTDAYEQEFVRREPAL